MNIKKWKPMVVTDAEKAGVCGQYLELLERQKDLTNFLSLYRRGARWSLEHNVPRIDMLRQCTEERLDLHGIYIDRHFDGDIFWDRQVYIFHNCTGTIRTGLNLDRRIAPILYFANGCNMRIESANADCITTPVHIPIYVYNNSHIEAEDSAKINCIYHISND